MFTSMTCCTFISYNPTQSDACHITVTYLLLPRLWGGCYHQWYGRRLVGWWERGCRWTCPPGKARCAGPAARSHPPLSGTSEATSPSPGSQDVVSKCSQEVGEGILKPEGPRFNTCNGQHLHERRRAPEQGSEIFSQCTLLLYKAKPSS